MTSPPRLAVTTTTRARSPTPAVMVWDAHTESFAPRSPHPHSSMQFTAYSHNLSHPPLPTSPSSPSSSDSRRLRHYSNPESILDFGEFLKQIDREERDHLQSSFSDDSHDATVPSAMPPTPSTSTKASVKNPFKSVLKEVLGGGGNNANQPLPKDAVVPSFGRGGVARTQASKSSLSSKATPTVATGKRDPYYAYVPFGSPPSPTSHYFPPNSNTPYPRSKSIPQPDPYTAMFGGADTYYYAGKPRNARQVEVPVSQAAEYARQQNRQQTAPSPAPTMSSTNSTSEESNDGNTAWRPLPLKIQTSGMDGHQQRRTRHRSKSFTSPTTPADGSAMHVGVFLHPEQAAMEAKLAEMQKQKSRESKDKDKDGSAVKVIVSPVNNSDDGHHQQHRRGREIDVISVRDDEDDTDVFSLSGFPAPPTTTPISATFSAAPPIPMPPRRDMSGSGPRPPPPARPRTLSGNRSQALRSRLPTMPPPTGALPPLPLHKTRSLRSIDAMASGRLPPPPPNKPPTPVNSSPRTMLPPPSSYPLPARRGSAPPSALSGGGYFPTTLPPIPPLASLLSNNNGTNPGVSQEVMLQQALERERQMLEERVRGLMWLVESLEGQQAASSSAAAADAGASAISRARSSSPSTATDKRSSTSTERAVTYLPYAR